MSGTSHCAPTATMAGRVFTGSCAFSSMSVNSRNDNDRSASTQAATMRRKINTMQEDEKQLEIEKSSSSLDESLLNPVVEVSCYCTEYNKSRPWLTSDTGMVNIGSGFAISGKKILTNAHVVTELNAITHVCVRKRGGSQIEYEATVHMSVIWPILEIDSTEFWEDMEPLEFGDIPPLLELVFVVGYPNGIYFFTMYQIFVLTKYALTKGSLDVSYQSMENAQIRNYFKMSPKMTGVLINKVNSSSGAHGILKENDIILATDGAPITNNGTLFWGNKERTSFDHLVSMKEPGETVLVKVLRKEKELEYNITLKPVKPPVKVQTYHNNLPSYYIFGGFVFVPFTKSYNIDGRDHYNTAGGQQVQISWVYSDNEGYNSCKDLQVVKVNEVKVKNLKHLCELIEGCCTKYVRLDFEYGKVMILNYESAKKKTSLVLKRHSITSAISKDLCLPPTS